MRVTHSCPCLLVAAGHRTAHCCCKLKRSALPCNKTLCVFRLPTVVWGDIRCRTISRPRRDWVEPAPGACCVSVCGSAPHACSDQRQAQSRRLAPRCSCSCTAHGRHRAFTAEDCKPPPKARLTSMSTHTRHAAVHITGRWSEQRQQSRPPCSRYSRRTASIWAAVATSA